MSKIRFKIDEKSLYFGIYNNYEKGEVMTSSTPINQSKDPEKWHKDILEFIDSGIDYKGEIPEGLLAQCTRKTTSQAKTIINNIFIFEKILFDGKELDCPYSFCLYVKEEVDEFIRQRDGKIGKNTHLGRKKLHNPSKLKYFHDGFKINNKAVLQAILEQNGGFAYIVRGFEVNLENKTLNFITSLIGLEGVFLSNVFKIKKGVGKKLLIDEINLEAQDIATDSVVLISSNKNKLNDVELDFEQLRKTQVENGKLGEKYVYENINKLINEYVEDVFHTSDSYPMSPYDIEYTDEDGLKRYVEVKSTSGSRGVFNMSSGEIKFMEKYKDRYALFLVKNVKSSFPDVKKYDYYQIMKLRKEYPSTRFYDN